MKFKNYLESIAGVGIFPVISLVVFFLFFSVLAYFVIRARKAHIHTMSHMPLEEADVHFPTTTTTN